MTIFTFTDYTPGQYAQLESTAHEQREIARFVTFRSSIEVWLTTTQDDKAYVCIEHYGSCDFLDEALNASNRCGYMVAPAPEWYDGGIIDGVLRELLTHLR